MRCRVSERRCLVPWMLIPIYDRSLTIMEQRARREGRRWESRSCIGGAWLFSYFWGAPRIR